MLKISGIGSVETVDKIKEVTKEFDDRIEFTFLKYQHKEETVLLTKKAQKIVIS